MYPFTQKCVNRELSYFCVWIIVSSWRNELGPKIENIGRLEQWRSEGAEGPRAAIGRGRQNEGDNGKSRSTKGGIRRLTTFGGIKIAVRPAGADNPRRYNLVTWSFLPNQLAPHRCSTKVGERLELSGSVA